MKKNAIFLILLSSIVIVGNTFADTMPCTNPSPPGGQGQCYCSEGHHRNGQDCVDEKDNKSNKIDNGNKKNK